MLNEKALKPCPFCGGEPKAHIWENNCGDGYSGVECTACSAEVAIPLSADDDGKAELQNAIEAWNRRATLPSSPVSELVERIRKMNPWNDMEWPSLRNEAADRLTSLEAENARLREANWMNRCSMLIDLIENMNSTEESAEGEDLDMVMAFKADLPSEAPQGGDHGE